jgi:hypothetical protein
MRIVRRRNAVALLSFSALVAGSIAAVGQAPSAPAKVAAPLRVHLDAATGSLPPAPVWQTAPGAMPQRPATCPPLPAASSSRSATVKAADVSLDQPSPTGDVLWPPPPAGVDPESYRIFDHTPVMSPPVTPSNWATQGNNWKLASTRSTDTAINSNPQELCGVEGSSVDLAWQTTTGRPTTVIAVLDSGIEWCSADLVNKVALNRAALPLPENSSGLTKPQLTALGQTFLDNDPYDLLDAGVLDAAQYGSDPRVAAVVAAYGGYYCASSGYDGVSAEDLIRTFADPTLPSGAKNPFALDLSGPTGYTEAIAGWNVLDNDDDAVDDVSFGHGTGEASDMVGSANSLDGEVGGCPSCMFMPVRVGTSFITTGNAFAAGVLFAVDSGATVISEALGTLDYTSTAVQAIQYAGSRGVPIVGSAADEESEHQNLPASLGHIIVVNSTNSETGWDPPSYLYLNGCTNYGGQISVTVPSSSCSSEATGKTAGVVGLLESAAADAVQSGKLTDYPGLKNALGQPVPLSANEVLQLVTMTADSVDFATAAPTADPPAPADNYAVSAPNVPFATTTMYPTTPGYNEYTGWGRLDAARIVQWVSEGRIPPEAEIDSPDTFATFSPTGQLVVSGFVGAVRSKSYRYQVDVGVGVAPAANSWHLVSTGHGAGSFKGVLGTVPLAELAALFPGGAAALTGGPVGTGGTPDPDRFTFTIRVLVEDASGNVGVATSPDFLHSDPQLVASYQFGSSITSPPRLAPLGPNGENVLLVAEADGTIHALLPNGHELPGWPVQTALAPAHPTEEAYTSGAVTDLMHGEIVGGVAVGDLADAAGHQLDVVVADTLGNVYAWNAAGKLLPGWPEHSNPNFSLPSARNAQNRLLPGFLAAPALADLTGNGQLDVVAPSLDRHVYAFSPDGRSVPGWPVLVVDPAEVQSVNPVTNQVTFLPSSNVDIGTELVDTPAIGSLTGSGPPEVVLGSDEEYDGTPYADLGALGEILSSSGAPSANSRVYAIWPNGSEHPAAPGSTSPPGWPDAGAFVPGWPAQIAQLDAGLLPTIGDGVTGSPVLAALKGGKDLDVVASSSGGPVYALYPNGTSMFGYGSDKLPKVGAYAPPGGSILDWTMPAVGSPVVAPVGAATATPSIVDPGTSLGRLVDSAFPGDQTPHLDEVDSWSALTGAISTDWPATMNDLQFLIQPIVADVNGAAGGGYVVEGSSLYDLRAYSATGTEPATYPKFTGGWMTYGAAFGPWGSLSDQVLAAGTRSGQLLVWSSPTAACASSGPWPQVHHDAWNTQDLSTTGAPSPTC